MGLAYTIKEQDRRNSLPCSFVYTHMSLKPVSSTSISSMHRSMSSRPAIAGIPPGFEAHMEPAALAKRQKPASSSWPSYSSFSGVS